MQILTKSFLFIMLVSSVSFAQSDPENDSLLSDDYIKTETPVIVVTGTRTEKLYENSPIPVTVISKEQIKESGFVRLTDILSEQTGITITSFLGSGAQMQGLDPDYTLIMIDGEPLIGRNGGTLDLNRISLGNIEQIEIVKGPSSSLYGSEALAGVINIITSKPDQKFTSKIDTRYGTHDNLDLTGDIKYSTEDFGLYFFANRYSSSGYDLTPDTESQTGAKFSTLTFNPRLRYNIGTKTDLSLNGKAYFEDITNIAILTGANGNEYLDDEQTLNEYDISGSLRHFFSEDFRLNLNLYSSYYKYESILKYQSDGSTYYEDNFKQTYNKAEVTTEANFLKDNITSFGTGGILESVEADRIYEGSRTQSNMFAFAQNEWQAHKNASFILGARFDAHSDYSSAFSPKIAAFVTPLSWISLRASYGAGFKAPTFQQLYLDFFNPQVGYSVYGTFNFLASYEQLESSGQIAEVFVNPNSIVDINPETSGAVNFGLEFKPNERIGVKINAFRNDIKDLIDIVTVAKKTNGQSVFTYSNISRVYTQGFDASLDLKVIETEQNEISLFFGYQFLETGNKDVIDEIESKQIFKTGSTGVVRPVQLVEYGGLFNRPMHSGVAKLSYTYSPLELTAYLRAVMKGKYGFADRNGNLILDNNNEYAPGYVLWNLNFTKSFKMFDIKLGVENMFDRTSLQYTPELPGRIIYAGIGARL
jgi:outer membrane receptor for ferrienterochelin and colicins